MFAYLGLIVIPVSWVTGYYMVRTWRGTRAMSLSQHAASNSVASKLFAIVLPLIGLGLYVWLVSWFATETQVSASFKALLTIAIVGLVVAALIPDTTGWQRRAHRAGAYSMAVLFMPLTCLIFFANGTGVFGQIVSALTAIYMVASWCLFFFVKQSLNHYLLFQVAYIALFQCSILAAAYLP